MMLIIFNFLEQYFDENKSSKLKSFFTFLITPIFYLLEYLVYRYYWKKIVIVEMLTSDEIVGMLEKNDFSYDGKIIKKADLLSENEYFDRLNLDEAKELIKKEYVLFFDELFQKNVAINIEDYITLIVTTETKAVKDKGEVFRDKIYTVTLMFCRYYYLQKIKTKLKIWLIVMSLISVIGLFIFKFIL